MRDRLIEILLDGVTFTDEYKFPARKQAEYVADRLLANGVIVPPFKVGQTVYYLTTIDTEKELNVCDIFCGTVQSIGFDGKNIWVSVKYTNGLYYHHKSDDFGKTVFLTREEAEKALKEREGEG